MYLFHAEHDLKVAKQHQQDLMDRLARSRSTQPFSLPRLRSSGVGARLRRLLIGQRRRPAGRFTTAAGPAPAGTHLVDGR